MKKVITFLLCVNITFAPIYAAIINDDFVENTLDKNLKIKSHQYQPIVDDFAMQNKNLNPAKKIIIIDEITPKEPLQKFSRKPVIFDDNYKEVKIKIKNYYTTKNKSDEGDYLDFVTLNEITIKNKTYPKNSLVKARIETISKNKAFGVPSDVVVDNFMLDNNKLTGEIKKQGANRSLWLYPVIYTTCCFFGVGLLLIPIRGGHAKIKPSETYILQTTE